MCDYPNLIGLFLTRDIPQTPKAAFKTYSDEELKRLNREIVKLDEQTARLMIIHQMLGTRISDTLTLAPDCLSEKNGEIIIRIRQMKTKPYEKPISAELAALIQMAIDYTKEKHGDTPYIFVDDKDTAHAMPYTKVQYRVTAMIYDKDLRDDNGELFGFSTHIYRHYYGVKLTEMHLDDWTIAKLLGHSSVRNVKYYRKMSNQLLADETRKARQKLSAIILNNLDGWEDEYEKYEKMVACNRKSSADKIELAKKTIFKMLDEGEKITIPKLIAKTGLSRGFFYKNPIVRSTLDKALEQQVGMTDP